MPDGTGPKSRALYVDTSESGCYVGVGIYEVDPKGPDAQGGYMARLLEGMTLEPEHAYEIAQRLTLKAMEAEENRKRQEL